METRRRKYIIIISILLHILILLLWDYGIKLGILGLKLPEGNNLNNQPLVFDLQSEEKPRQVIETPEHARVDQQENKARFLSDKNAQAMNPENAPDLEIGEPFSRGVMESHESPIPRGTSPERQAADTPRPQREQQPEQKNDATKLSDYLDPNKQFPFSEPTPESEAGSDKPGLPQGYPGVLHENLNSQTLEKGGLSFNTYDWNFAPYMLALKRKIQQNIFPPMAFTHLGMIDGETLLRFRIYPDGKLVGLQILDYQGHKTLMETSYYAVQVSAPFDKLPPDFPEPYLEVTGKFIYFVPRAGNK